MTWAFVAIAAVFALVLLVRRHSIRPSWHWSDVQLELSLGSRSYPVLFSEVTEVFIAEGALWFVTARGHLPFTLSYVTEEVWEKVAVACGMSLAHVQQAAASPTPFTLWRGYPGEFQWPGPRAAIAA
jgi:hypothetical protein